MLMERHWKKFNILLKTEDMVAYLIRGKLVIQRINLKPMQNHGLARVLNDYDSNLSLFIFHIEKLIPSAIVSAIFITNCSLVFCKTIYSIYPPRFTMPIM